jgi:hypothetical protein
MTLERSPASLWSLLAVINPARKFSTLTLRIG